MKRFLIFFSFITLVLAISGCATKGIIPMSAEDNPPHHFLQGMDLLDKGDIGQAESHFKRAIQLDPEYPQAHAGMALVSAMKAEGYDDGNHRSVEWERAMEFFDDAKGFADSDSEKFSVWVTGIRVFTHGKPKDWIEEAQDLYDRTSRLKHVDRGELLYYRGEEAKDYFMGLAAFRALHFRDAEDLLSNVTKAPPGRWHQPAAALFKKVHKIVRAMANYTLTDVAGKIAIKDEVVRSDVAALLVDEIHLDRLMAGRIPVPGTDPKADFTPADVVNHPFQSEVMTVLKWNLRGLEPAYDETTRAYLFVPDGNIKRKELAFILEDVLTKITGDETIPTAFFGQKKSPFPDVSPNSPWFNAVMNAVSRNLMESGLSGAFRPDATVDGAELLLAVLRLRDAMNIY